MEKQMAEMAASGKAPSSATNSKNQTKKKKRNPFEQDFETRFWMNNPTEPQFAASNTNTTSNGLFSHDVETSGFSSCRGGGGGFSSSGGGDTGGCSGDD